MRNVLKGQRCLVISSEGNKLLACSDLDVQRKVDQDQITANITDNSASLRLMLLLLLQLACDQITDKNQICQATWFALQALLESI